jgi:choline dehydrogenase
MTGVADLDADYVVVGSGAGGGPFAMRLAEAGFSVLVIEAGGDEEDLAYQVPAFHAYASEDAHFRWDFYTRHYDDEAQQSRDPKYVPAQGGVLYPRSATVGGCTAHNALITMYPNDQDWDAIADLTGDESWRSAHMRGYFERLERCGYRRRPWPWPTNTALRRLLASLPLLGSRFRSRGHGYDGWLSTDLAKIDLLLQDPQLIKVVASAAERELAGVLGRPLHPWEGLEGWLDPNDEAVQRSSLLGVWLVPLATALGSRNGTREALQRAAAAPAGKLQILTHALATKLVLDEGGRCVGVDYLTGASLYRADPRAAQAAPGRPGRAWARREVILAGGAFNTPQLLKLSGIGPAAELNRWGIEVAVDLPGVGQNLQDRYEATVITELSADFRLITGGAFRPPQPDDPPDPYLARWRNGEGPYTTNGALLAVVAKSDPQLEVPDLFLFALPASFRGYYPGYADDLQRTPNRLTWAVLKAHTANRAGEVLLRSADPLDPPDIRFHYFGEGSDTAEHDLDAVVAGLKLARRLTARLDEWTGAEILPGKQVRGDEALRDYVRDNAWGHHASCSCPIGAVDDPMAVLDSKFRVRGVPGLRVVDASAFPRIPGYFIAAAIFMISEKAADTVLAEAATDTDLADWPTVSPSLSSR